MFQIVKQQLHILMKEKNKFNSRQLIKHFQHDASKIKVHTNIWKLTAFQGSLFCSILPVIYCIRNRLEQISMHVAPAVIFFFLPSKQTFWMKEKLSVEKKSFYWRTVVTWWKTDCCYGLKSWSAALSMTDCPIGHCRKKGNIQWCTPPKVSQFRH